jgi:hypothetical protein
MASDASGKYNPFYRQVSGDVSGELNKRGDFYGSRVRSQRVVPGTKGFPEAERLLWSYGKTAYAIVRAGGITLGGSGTRVMSDRGGNLTLYDSTRNQPKYPLLQSIELSNEGTIGSLLKGSFTFTVYPDISSSGFAMEGLENAFFKPGKEVTIKYGWSVRDGGPNNGELTGIIYNFDWSVNNDLSITAKCSIVSKATIAIGVSGEQTNKETNDPKEDPLGQPIPDGDLAGILESDVKLLGGLQNKSVNTGTTKYYTKSEVGGSQKFDYYVIGMPMSLADVPDDQLSDADKQKKADYESNKETQNKKNDLVKKFATGIQGEKEARVGFEKAKASGQTEFVWRENGVDKKGDAGAYDAYLTKISNDRRNRLREEYRSTFGTSPGSAGENDLVKQAESAGTSAAAAKASGQATAANQNQGEGPYGAKAPAPVTQPVYFVKLGDLTQFVNLILDTSPLGASLFTVQCFGNTTKHLPDIASSAPERVFFPDDEMGTYGDFKPYAGSGFLKNETLIDIGNILISTTAVIETYRSFVKENQTSIEYKNLTGFFDKLIQEVNFASGEMYQLATQLIDPPKGGKGGTKAILAIEDTNIASEVIDKVTPFPFTATIAKPILKSVSISCKPPAASAAAAYTQARGDGRVGGDVSYSAKGVPDEFTAAYNGIQKSKDGFLTNGAGPQFTTGLKGNYARYKRTSPANESSHWLTKVLYPIDFSLTIDGIDGFKFGDVIQTNLIPSRYNQEGMVFVVTKIGHTIQNGVWETTLNTKARIDPSKLQQ